MSNKALFLDRDGVINVDKGYVYKQKDIKFVDGIFELCKHAQSLGYKIIIVTNQSGIGRGLYTESDFHTLMNWMSEQFSNHGVTIDETYFCPNHPEHGEGSYKIDCDDRKPKPGMLLKAKEAFNLNMNACIMIGDKDKDMQAAKAAGIPTRLLFGGSDASSAATRTIDKLSLATMEL